jgi:AcrR family transcriptional regulator
MQADSDRRATVEPAEVARETTRGRPRTAGLDARILETTLQLLTEVGYEAMSIQSVATCAGVSKTTIYRRYAGKAVLVAAAADHRGAQQPPQVLAGDLRKALEVTVSWLARGIGEQEIGLLGALFAGMRADPELADAMRHILQRHRSALIASPIATVIASQSDAVTDGGRLFAEVATAMIVHRVVVDGAPCDDVFVGYLVDQVLLPLLRGPSQRRSRDGESTTRE